MKGWLFAGLILFLFLGSCNKNEEPIGTQFSDVIVGTWHMTQQKGFPYNDWHVFDTVRHVFYFFDDNKYELFGRIDGRFISKGKFYIDEDGPVLALVNDRFNKDTVFYEIPEYTESYFHRQFIDDEGIIIQRYDRVE